MASHIYYYLIIPIELTELIISEDWKPASIISIFLASKKVYTVWSVPIL